MRFQILFGIALVVFGLIALATGGITYTRREKIIDIGSIEATREQHQRISFPPLVSGLALAGGVALLITARRKS